MSDLIRREDAIDAALTFLVEYCGAAFDEDMQKMLCERLDALPSAEPERVSMVWKPADGRPAYEKGICSCGYVLSVLQRDFVYCPMCGCRLEWG